MDVPRSVAKCVSGTCRLRLGEGLKPRPPAASAY